MSERRYVEPSDLAGVSEVVNIIWPDGAGLLHSHRAQVTMWAERRATTGFPQEIVTLACGPIYSKREVVRWWDRYRTSPAHLRALRGADTRRERRGGARDATAAAH